MEDEKLEPQAQPEQEEPKAKKEWQGKFEKGVHPPWLDEHEFNKLPPERLHEISVKGGKARVEQRRKHKRMTEAAKWLLAAKDVLSDAEIKKIMTALGFSDATNAEALMVIAMKKASKGDVDALKFVRDTAGEAPKNQVELSGDTDRPVATLDLRGMSEDELLRLAEAKADSASDKDEE